MQWFYDLNNEMRKERKYKCKKKDFIHFIDRNENHE